MRSKKKIRPAVVIFVAFMIICIAYVWILAEDSNRRADAMIQEVDILTDGMGR